MVFLVKVLVLVSVEEAEQATMEEWAVNKVARSLHNAYPGVLPLHPLTVLGSYLPFEKEVHGQED